MVDLPNKIEIGKYACQYDIHNFARKTSARAISGVLKNLSVPANREFGNGCLSARERSGDEREEKAALFDV